VIPQTAGAVLGLLLVVAPGIVFEVIREHYRPTAERSTFREASAMAVASLVFAFTALLILAAVRAVWPNLLPSPHDWIIEGKAYVAGNFGLVAWFVVALVVLSTGLGALFAWAWFRRSGARIDPNTQAWYELFRAKVPDGGVPMVRVKATDGTEYLGRVIDYSANILPAERELVLGPPLQRKLPGSDDFELLPDDGAWARVCLPGTSIESFWVRYPPREPPRK
jgi:hypothetical protein